MFTNWLTSTTSSTASSSLSSNAPTPDIIIEVGPPPYARYAAHSALLSAHSGYLRSAIRPDERSIIIDSSSAVTAATPIYVPNVTAEQFAPLLTYMYTGYLDLNIENIFSVLLATHVLHMPRALEICRAFLARTQSEGYLGGAFLPTLLNGGTTIDSIGNGGNSSSETNAGCTKIVRPIASKASGGHGLSFIAAPVANVLVPSHDTPFKSLSSSIAGPSLSTATDINTQKKSSSLNNNQHLIVSAAISLNQHKKSLRKRKRIIQMTSAATSAIDADKLKKSSTKLSSDDIAASTADESIKTDDKSSNKIIIDIASCDGPVRFLRVLNDSYGRPPPPTSSSVCHSNGNIIERNHQNLTTSFHLQMAKNISERTKQQQQQQSVLAEESENSQEIFVDDSNSSSTIPITTTTTQNIIDNGNQPNNLSSVTTKSDDVYVCVYCKHTFKSQYCYQKHAKRHINPLHIDGELIVETIDSGSEKDEKVLSTISSSAGNSISEHKREVRPLDMNVQYYPCKTCGSKFPSYYFVHKHRKLCHENEEN